MSKIRLMAVVLVTASVAFGAVTVYTVEPLNMANSAFVHRASEDLVAVADSLREIWPFLGARQDTGNWVATIYNEHGTPIGQAARTAATCTSYSFVRFAFLTPIGVRKGAKYSVEIKHSSGNPVTEVFWDPNNPYPYGGITVTGSDTTPPAGSDLACRIVGVNNPVSPFFWGTHARVFTDVASGWSGGQEYSALARAAGFRVDRDYMGMDELMTLTGIRMEPPPETMPNANCDLACRITGRKKAVDSASAEA